MIFSPGDILLSFSLSFQEVEVAFLGETPLLPVFLNYTLHQKILITVTASFALFFSVTFGIFNIKPFLGSAAQ